MKPRTTFWLILIITFGSLLGIYLTRAGVYYRMFYFSAILIIVSWVWAKISIRKIEINRKARGHWQQLGDVFEEQFEVRNPTSFTRSWLEIEDGSGLPGSGTSRVLSSVKQSITRNYSGYTLLSKRGEFSLSPTILRSGDPFGLFLNEKYFYSDNSLLVLPYLVDIKLFPNPYGRLPGGIAVKRRTPQIEPPRVASVREHAPGDALNRIHWPTSARKDRLMVKEFEQDPQAEIWIFLDAEKKNHIGQMDHGMKDRLEEIPVWWLNRADYKLPRDTFEYAVCAAGTIAKFYLRNDQAVGFATSGQNRITLSSERGERQLSKILETLAHLQPVGTLPIPGLVKSQTESISKGSTVILITASTEKETISSIIELIRKGMNPILILLDPSSFGASYDISDVISALKNWKTPCIPIKYGEDIQSALEGNI